jgi:thiosulfate/3-mercaptopyruvate sulfurtransferase
MRFILLFLLTALVAFSTDSRAVSFTGDTLSVDLTADDPIISAGAAQKLVGKPGVVFLHVGRDADAFAEGHIAGARFLPLSAFTEERNGVPFELPGSDQLVEVFGRHGVTADSRVIVYSDASLGDIDVLAAARAFFSLEAIGHGWAQVIDGGLDAWRRAEYEVAVGEPETASSVNYGETRPRRQVVVDAEAVHARLEDAALFLVDARPPAEFTGETGGASVERPGHIPGAKNLFWKTFLKEDGTLKSTDELAAIWTDAGVLRHHNVVVYCRTGMQASHAYLVARHLGIVPQMYDPSYLDWSNNTEFPVTRLVH